MKTTNNVQKTGNKPFKKTISLLSVRFGHTDVMIGCWMSQFGVNNRLAQKRIISTNF